MASYAQYLTAIKNALSGVSSNKQALRQLYDAHEQLVTLADRTQGYSNDAHMVSCLEGALQLVTRCRMLGPMHAFFTADELLQCMLACLEDAKRMRQVGWVVVQLVSVRHACTHVSVQCHYTS
jgi:hypothetical protein